MRIIYVVLMMLILIVTAGTAAARMPVLVAQISGDDGRKKSEELRLARVDTEVTIHGWLAETRMTMTFANPTDRILAGDLYFPLPEGSTVSGYALDINGVMVDGVVVEKDKGRQVFEKIVRQGTDPGLVEWVAGNNFKTRVFPIPARGSRTIMVRYLSGLTDLQGSPSYQLPLHFTRPVADFHLRLEVVKGDKEPVIASGGLPRLGFTKWRESFLAETTLRDVAPDENLVVALPYLQKSPVVIEQSDGEVFFTIHDMPPVPLPLVQKPPKRVGILWDASGSRGEVGHDKEIALLRAFFARFPESAIVVELVQFRNSVTSRQQVKVVNGDIAALLALLQQVDYDGGTSLAAIVPAKEVGLPDFFLLFSDGLSNFGSTEPGSLSRPLYAISADPRANHSMLRYLAMKSGGDYINLNNLDPARGAAAIGNNSFSFLGARYDSRSFAKVTPSIPQAVQGRVQVSGRLLAEKGNITLEYGYAGQVTHRSEYQLDRSAALPGNLARLSWAGQRLAELQVLAKENRAEITALGKRYGLVTPGTSLLVLENVNQYVEHRVEPPTTLPELRREYEKIIAARNVEQERKKGDKLHYLISLWQRRVAWWEKEFSYPAGFRYQEAMPAKSSIADMQGGALSNMGASFSRPQMAESPAPAAEQLAGRSERKMAAKKNGGSSDDRDEAVVGPTITIKPWNPDTPYLRELQRTAKSERYRRYLQLRREYSASPAFFLDCADLFRQAGDQQLALQILSNLAELELENPALLRILAHRLEQMEQFDLAVIIFDEVLNLRPEEPQSHRDLGLVLARRAESVVAGRDKTQVLADYRRSIELLYQVAIGEWDRIAEIELIALTELNRTIPRAIKAGIEGIPVDPRLIKPLDMDMRIVLTWDMDMTDLDLWVIEPSGEKAYYGHQQTTIGGSVSRDITVGYGPEEYVLKKGMAGIYRIEANYFGSNAPQLAGTATVQATVFTNYGRPDEERRAITLRLEQKRDTVRIGEVEFRAK